MPKLKQYDKSKMEEAIKDIQSGVESYRTAEKKYGIPKSTLEFKLKHPGHKESLGPSPILNQDEENTLVRWIADTASKGFPRKANDLKTSVQQFLTVNPRPHNFKNNRPGDGWLKGFLKRHPIISTRTAEGVTASSACVSEQDIRNWFSSIYDYIKEKGIEEVLEDPSRIFNGDESGFQICPSTGKVFAMKGSQNVYSVERASSKENVTVMFTFSADGSISVPMIIYPYQRIPEKIAKSVNPKWGLGRSENGWMTAETFYQYIANVFYPHLIENKIKLPVILFLDGHKSHLSYQISCLCNELKIEIISLYPNATRILQPCDVSVFRPLKEAWRQCIRQFEEEHPGEVVNKLTFAPLLEQAISKGVKPETIVSGFRACGLYPFDANAVDYSKCLGKKSLEQSKVTPVTESAVKMDLNIFVDIIGQEKVTLLRKLHQNSEEIGPVDEHLNLLLNIWKYFHGNEGNIITQVAENSQSRVNIIQNIVIASPFKNLQVHANNSEQVTNRTLQPEVNNDPSKPSPANDLRIDLNCTSSEEQNLYFQPSTSKVIIKNNLLGSFLESPSAPERKGKRETDRFPFAVTSVRYQEMYRKKQELKEIQEKLKEERKRKREENNCLKQSTKGKKGKQLNKCCICTNDIRSGPIRCDECKMYFHQKCVPRSHQSHIPSDDDLFLCHSCYRINDDSDDDSASNEINMDLDDRETDELYEFYKQEQKKSF